MAFVLLMQPSMARPLRYVPPGTTVEVTTRTIQSRFLLRPSPELNDVVLGVLGRALSLYAVELHAFAVMSNHMHLLLTPASGQELAAFMRHVNRNISQEAGRLHDWRGPLWARRYRCIPVVDEASQIHRLRYILAQGCKEGLVPPVFGPCSKEVHCTKPGDDTATPMPIRTRRNMRLHSRPCLAGKLSRLPIIVTDAQSSLPTSSGRLPAILPRRAFRRLVSPPSSPSVLTTCPARRTAAQLPGCMHPPGAPASASLLRIAAS
jgi:REP element-mobilizing transposase RayT